MSIFTYGKVPFRLHQCNWSVCVSVSLSVQHFRCTPHFQIRCPLPAVRCPLSAVRCPLSAVRCSAILLSVSCCPAVPLSAVPLSAVPLSAIRVLLSAAGSVPAGL